MQKNLAHLKGLAIASARAMKEMAPPFIFAHTLLNMLIHQGKKR